MMINSTPGISSVLRALALCLAISSTVAFSQVLVVNYPQVDVVVEGDTLWDISIQVLQDAWGWREVCPAISQVENPDLG